MRENEGHGSKGESCKSFQALGQVEGGEWRVFQLFVGYILSLAMQVWDKGLRLFSLTAIKSSYYLYCSASKVNQREGGWRFRKMSLLSFSFFFLFLFLLFIYRYFVFFLLMPYFLSYTLQSPCGRNSSSPCHHWREVILLTLVLDADKDNRTSSKLFVAMKLYSKGLSRIHFHVYFWLRIKFQRKPKTELNQSDPVPISSTDKFECEPALHPPLR